MLAVLLPVFDEVGVADSPAALLAALAAAAAATASASAVDECVLIPMWSADPAPDPDAVAIAAAATASEGDGATVDLSLPSVRFNCAAPVPMETAPGLVLALPALVVLDVAGAVPDAS